MIRYENPKRFWEAHLTGCTLLVRQGTIGSDGKATEKTLPSEAAANKELDKRIKAIEKKQYEPVPLGLEPQPSNPELEHSIVEADDVTEALQVYGDWLQAQGDPRGELAALQHALSEKTDAKLDKQVAKLLSQHGARFIPPHLAEMLRKRPGKDKPLSGYCELRWRSGFILGARLGRNSNKPPHTLRELTATLLAHPSARLLRKLEIGDLGQNALNQDYSEVVGAIATARPTALRRLMIAQCDDLESVLGNVAPLCELPRLEHLWLRGGTLSLDGARMNRLTALDLECGILLRNGLLLQELARVELPALRRLALRFDERAGDPAATSALLSHLVRSPLVELGLIASENSGALISLLLESPLIKQLKVLDLSDGALTDEDTTRLARDLAPGALGRLCVHNNHLTETGAERLRPLCDTLEFGTQRPRPVGGLTGSWIRDFAGNSRTLTSARGLARVEKWNRLGQDQDLLWGEYTGSDTYEVFVRLGEDLDSACTCPSWDTHCKHAVALTLMAQQGLAIPKQPAPAGLIGRCEEGRYNTGWE